jgi:hypothetical protein
MKKTAKNVKCSLYSADGSKVIQLPDEHDSNAGHHRQRSATPSPAVQSSQVLKMEQVGRGSQTMAVFSVMLIPLKS